MFMKFLTCPSIHDLASIFTAAVNKIDGSPWLPNLKNSEEGHQIYIESRAFRRAQRRKYSPDLFFFFFFFASGQSVSSTVV